MKLKAASILICLLLTVGTAYAQRDCGDGLPCGKLPWDLPLLLDLPSPTPMPTLVISAEGTEEAAPTVAPTQTPAPTGTIAADFTDLDNQLATLQGVVNATPLAVEVNGTPVDPNEQFVEIGEDAGTFFGYLRGFSEMSLGGFSPFIGFAILSLVVIIGMKSLGWLLPVAAVLFRLILRIVEVIKALIGL
jgi:hypothetical protein